MAKLGVGVLGVGRMGRRHAENLRSLVPEAKLVAVADVDVEAADRCGRGIAEQVVDALVALLIGDLRLALRG